MAQATNQEAFDRALGYFNEARRTHGNFVKKVEKNYKAYRGVLERGAEAAQWTSKAHPPYIQHIVETTLASLVDDHLRFKIRPRLTLDQMNDEGAAERARQGADAHQVLMDWQLRKDKFSEIQRPFVLQNQIAGLTVAKTYWTTIKERRRQVTWQEAGLTDAQEQPILHPATGQQMTVPQPQEKTTMATCYDGPTTEVRDVRDFLWHEAATSLDKARYVIDRVWLSWEDIEDGFAAGQFGPDRGGWDIKKVQELIGDGKRELKDEYTNREQDLFKTNRTKDLCEVVEVWDQIRHEVTTIINRTALLAFRPFPFFHEKAPFAICSTQPDLFQIPGISQVEKIKHLQDLLWTIMNQRIDNLQLINNAIFLFRPDLEDPDQYTFEPGARWPVEDPAQVTMWTPNEIPAEVSLGSEALVKGDMQNLAGGFPFSSGTDSGNVDQQTATGASIITNIAQKSIGSAKQQVYQAWNEVGHQRMCLNQQFIRAPMVAPVLGVNDQEELREIFPELLAGDYDFELEPVPDALVKQEEQASAQALLQLFLAAAPVVAPLSQAGLAKMLNIDAVVQDTLKAFGKEDVERYFVSSPAPSVAPGGDGAQGGENNANAVATDQTQETPVEQSQNLGVTAPQATSPATSPSAAISQSPATIMSRALALSKGGGRNV